MNAESKSVPPIEVLVTASEAAVAATIEQYATEFRIFSLQTSNAIIKMALVVYKAKSNLNGRGQFLKFCEAIKYQKNSSSLRKLEQIGKHAELLGRHADNLPNTWTSLYTLVQLGDEVLEILLDENKIHSKMTGKEIRDLVAEYFPKKNVVDRNIKKAGYALNIKLNDTLNESEQEQLDALIADYFKSKGKAFQFVANHAATVNENSEQKTDLLS